MHIYVDCVCMLEIRRVDTKQKIHKLSQLSSTINVCGASYSSVLFCHSQIRAELHPSAAHIVCLYRFWGERFDLHIVKVYSSVLLVYANLIFALLMCQSYKSYLVHRISILYHGDDNVDCNILCLESVHIIPMSIFWWFMCPKIIPTCTHSSFDASLAYVTNVWF